MSKSKSKSGGGLLACVWCGYQTRGRVRGHAACTLHAEHVDVALTSAGRSYDTAVVTTIDFDPKRQLQRMGTIHVRAAAGLLGGRVVLDVVEGDAPTAVFLGGNVLRADGARALAALLTAAADRAEKMQAVGEPPESERAPAKPLASKHREG